MKQWSIRALLPVTVALLLLAATSQPSAAQGKGDAAQGKGDDLKGVTDEKFVEMASMINLAEIQLGKLALERASHSDVKKFAQHMVEDHTKSNSELANITGKKGMMLAKDLDKKHKDVAAELMKFKGDEFDRHYIMHMVEGHQKAATLFEHESKNGKDTDVKSYAAKTLPVILEHLKMAKMLQGQKNP